MLKHRGVGRAAGGEKPPKSEGGSGASLTSGGYSSILLYYNTSPPYLFENILIYLDICGSICNFVAQKEKIDG